MKKVFFLVGFSIPILLSMTFKEANSNSGHSPQVHFTIPVKPKSTIIIDNCYMNKYLKKGYQVQQMVHTTGDERVKLLMVKY